MGGFLNELAGVLAIFFLGSIILIPLLGITLRFALKPLIESVAKLQGADRDESMRLLAERFEGLEGDLSETQRELAELRAANEFERRLKAPE